jgi:hypothetical protein
MTKQKAGRKDPPFQKPKKESGGTPTRKDKFKAASASLRCASRPHGQFLLWIGNELRKHTHERLGLSL